MYSLFIGIQQRNHFDCSQARNDNLSFCSCFSIEEQWNMTCSLRDNASKLRKTNLSYIQALIPLHVETVLTGQSFTQSTHSLLSWLRLCPNVFHATKIQHLDLQNQSGSIVSWLIWTLKHSMAAYLRLETKGPAVYVRHRCVYEASAMRIAILTEESNR